MGLFMCFGGSAAVVDMDAARHRSHQRERARSLSFRGKFLPGSRRKDKTKKPSPAASPTADATKKQGVDADDGSVPSSSARLSSAASLEYSGSASSASSRSSTSSSVSSSASVSGVLFPPPPAAKRRASEGPATTCPAAGPAAVVLCLLMVVFCGRVGATVITSTALYLFPRRWPISRSSMHQEDGVGYPLECGAAAMEVRPQRKVVTEGVLVTNRNN